MKKFLYFLKNNIIKFLVCTLLCLIVALNLALLIFDIIQFVSVSANVARLSGSFFAFNLSAMIINFVAIFILILLIVLRRIIKKTSA